MDYYAIPDIHGRSDLLQMALREIYARNPNGGKIIFLGDYVDRGYDTPGVISLVMNPPENWKFICLMGNHEEMLQIHIEGWAELYDPIVSEQYGGEIPDYVGEWIKTLKMYHIEGDNIFVHADWDELKAPDAQTEVRMLWTRRPKWEPFLRYDKYLIHGHTPCQDGPIFAINRCNMDTGAVWSGRLHVAVLEEGKKGIKEVFHVSKWLD